VKLASRCVALSSLAGLAGCQDLKPLRAELSDLRVEVTGLQAQVEAGERAARQAEILARAATEMASSAQQSASVALAVAQGAKTASVESDARVSRVLEHGRIPH
jgi:hypothetical protein